MITLDKKICQYCLKKILVFNNQEDSNATGTVTASSCLSNDRKVSCFDQNSKIFLTQISRMKTCA